MLVVCAWCERSMGEKPGPDEVTHGICPDCMVAQLRADNFSEEEVKRCCGI